MRRVVVPLLVVPRPAIAPIAGAAVVAVLVAVLPAPAGAAPSSWAGWSSVGPPPRVGAASALAASGDLVVVLGDDANRSDGLLRFAVTSAAGDRSGVVPAALGRRGTPLSDETDRGRHAVTIAGGRRVVVAHACEIRTTTSLGRLWTSALLPGCGPEAGVHDPPAVAFADADHGVAAQGRATWSTGDGGRRWRRTATDAGGDVVGVATLSATSVVRVVSSPSSRPDADRTVATPSHAVERSDDGGATWTVVPIPVPPPPPGAPPRPPGSPAVVVALPAPLSAPVRRADGVLLIGGPASLLRSDDGARTFTIVPVPSPPAPAPGVTPADPLSFPVGAPICDPAARCVVPRGTDAVPLDGGAFGAPVPSPPPAATAPVPGRIVGLQRGSTGSGPSGPVVTSDNGGGTYAVTEDGGYGAFQPGAASADSGVLAVDRPLATWVSTDRGRTFAAIPRPTPATGAASPGTVGFARLGGALVRLGRDGRLRPSPDDGRVLAELAPIAPTAIAGAGGAVVAAGPAGVARVGADGRALIVPTGALREVRPAGGTAPLLLRARGSFAVAARGTTLLRSVDGGRRWARGRLPAGLDDLEVVGPGTVLALRGRELLRSTDGARRFRRVAIVPPIRAASHLDDAQPNFGFAPSALDFADARHGVVVTEDGAFLTGDGGRTFTPVPVPADQPPAAAFVTGGRAPRVTVVDDATGVLYRRAGRARPTRMDLRTVGGVRRSGGRRAQRVAGVLRGAPPGAPVQFLAAGPGGERSVGYSAFPDRRGRFRARVRLAARERTVRAVFAGSVTPARTFAPATSGRTRIPALPDRGGR